MYFLTALYLSGISQGGLSGPLTQVLGFGHRHILSMID